MSDENFLLEYEKLLDKGYCDCNEMNCIDNNAPRRILNITKKLQQENEELKKRLEEHIKAEMKMENELEKQREEYQETYRDVREEIKEYKNQQKEFIEWLEIRIKDRDKVRKMHELYSLSEERLSSQYFVLQDVLSKYKKIIGVKDE